LFSENLPGGLVSAEGSISLLDLQQQAQKHTGQSDYASSRRSGEERHPQCEWWAGARTCTRLSALYLLAGICFLPLYCAFRTRAIYFSFVTLATLAHEVVICRSG